MARYVRHNRHLISSMPMPVAALRFGLAAILESRPSGDSLQVRFGRVTPLAWTTYCFGVMLIRIAGDTHGVQA